MPKVLSRDWKKVKLGEVIKSIENGNRPKGGSDQFFEGIPSIGGEHISDSGGFNFEKIKYIPKDFYDNLNRGKIYENDVLVVKDGATTGKVAIANKQLPFSQTAVNEHVFILRGNSSLICQEYLFFFIFSEEGQRRIKKNITGSAQGGINQSFLNNYTIPLPSLPTQHKIVEILEEADNLRKLRQQADEKMKDLIPSLFVQMFGDPAKNPKGWETKTIGDICNRNTGIRNPSDLGNGYFQYVDISSIDNITGVITTSRKISNIDAPSRARKVIKTEDVIVSTVRPNLNAVAIVPSTLNNQICSTGFCVLRVHHEVSSHHYIYAITRSKFFVESMSKKTQGASYPAVSDKDIFDFAIPTPPLPLQQEFAKIVEEIEAEKARQTESRKKLDDLFASLMQRAFAGKLVA
jgi:type I restriction enzyme S subunit